MDLYTVKKIVCDYGVVSPYEKVICICNCRSNAEYIADILNADSSEQTAYTYNSYKSRKWDIRERETCKDCSHYKKDFSFSDKPMCLSHGLITVNDDLYCADFERREE